jgi:hypothetical protein
MPRKYVKKTTQPKKIVVKPVKKLGRPPVQYSDQALKNLGEELIHFLQAHDESIVHLSMWYNKIKGIPKNKWSSLIQRPALTDYYERALEWVGCNILESQDLPTAYGSRFLSSYFKDLRDHERKVKQEEIEHAIDYKAKMELSKSTPPNDQMLSLNLDLIKQVRELQKELDVLKKDGKQS